MGDSTGERDYVEEASRIVEQAKELQDAASSLISRTTREEDSLRQKAKSLDSSVQQLRSSVRKSKLDSNQAEKLEEELFKASYVLSEGDAAAFLPSKSHGGFLRMFLGPINVRANRKDVQFKVKEEYNSFRDSISIPSFPIVATRLEVLDVGWMFTSVASATLPGLVALPLHRFGSAGEHFESEWK